MKKILLISTIVFFGFLSKVDAQALSAVKLKKYCLISNTAEYILTNAKSADKNQNGVTTIGVLTSDASITNLNYDYYHGKSISLKDVANMLSLHASRQINGENGNLEIGGSNYLLTNDVNGNPTAVFLTWAPQWGKWTIWSAPLKKTSLFGGIKKGTRFISYDID